MSVQRLGASRPGDSGRDRYSSRLAFRVGVSDLRRPPGLVQHAFDVVRKKSAYRAHAHGRPVATGAGSLVEGTGGLLPGYPLPDLIENGMGHGPVPTSRLALILLSEQERQRVLLDLPVQLEAP